MIHELRVILSGADQCQKKINEPRRKLIGATALGFIAAQLGTAAPAFAQNNAPRRGTPSTGSFGPLKRVNAGVLSVAYADAGSADGPPVLLLHGWPYDIHSFVDVAPILATQPATACSFLFARLRRDAVSLVGHAMQRPAAAVATDAINFLDCAQNPEGPRCGIRLGRQNREPDGVSLA